MRRDDITSTWYALHVMYIYVGAHIRRIVGFSNEQVFIMSAEPSQRKLFKAYSQDIRWRVVYQRMAIKLAFAKQLEHSSKYKNGSCDVYVQSR